MTKPNSLNTIGLFLTAAAVGLGLVSALRYSADASEFLSAVGTETTEGSSVSVIEDGERYRFSMEVMGAASEYESFEISVVAQGFDAQAVLQAKKRDGETQAYEKALDEETFVAFWRTLRSLETAQLSDLSPHSEAFVRRLDSAAYSSAEVDKVVEEMYEVPKVEPSATYRFMFQDGLYDYPNSFEVYAPDALEDTRYRALRDSANRLAEEVFGLSS